jgi:hypothetical protein|tara:strand:- start:1134 stop:1919 length:786 start_codon:yes stop_codon:yes gene_type:complete
MVRCKINETNTYPKIIHANGNSKRSGLVYESIINKFLTTQKPIIDADSDLTIVTWKGGKYKNEETILEKCMRFYDHPIAILDWPENEEFWEASKTKIVGTLNFLNSNINTKYFMWFDAGDVVLTEPPSKILEVYKNKFNDKLVFCAERNHYPKENRQLNWSVELRNQYKKLENDDNQYDVSFKYMNTGCCVGKTDIVIEFLKTCKKWLHHPINDTVAGRLAQKEMSDRVVVDRNCELFVCLYDVSIDEVKIDTKTDETLNE